MKKSKHGLYFTIHMYQKNLFEIDKTLKAAGFNFFTEF